MDQPAVIVFVRHPTPGRAKTRLARTVGDHGAALFYSDCARNAVRECSSIAGASCYVFFASADEDEAVRRWLDPLQARLQFVAQLQAADLGARMAHALRHALSLGHPRAVLVGSDVPDLWSGTVRVALEALREHDMVLGAAYDGGYYLIGLSRAPPAALFAGVRWSTPAVLQQTADNAERLGLDLAPLEGLPTLWDIDTGDDLRAWATSLRRRIERGERAWMEPRGAEHEELLRTAERVLHAVIDCKEHN